MESKIDELNFLALTPSELALSHHGVKGMKWGVWNEETKARRSGSSRSNRKEMANRKKAIRKEAKEIAEATKKAKAEAKINEPLNKAKRDAIKFDRKQASKNRSLLSDKELQEMTNRLQKERQLRELTGTELYRGKRLLDKFTNTGVEIVQAKAKQAAGVQKKKK